MKQTINQQGFYEAFKQAGRANDFSRWALDALFDHIEAADPSTELDVIAVCGEYVEQSLEDAADDYVETPDEIVRYLQRNTTVVAHDDKRVVYAQF